MASPFRTFRKNKKVWMAGLVILSMFAFVVFTNPTMNSRTGGPEQNVVLTKFGNLTQMQIANLRSERRSLISFFQALRDILNGQKFPDAASRANGIHSLLGQESEDEAIHRWIYARTAESMGIVVDNKSVDDLLNFLLLGVQNPQAMINAALRSTQGGMNPEQFVSIMRKQLFALRLIQLGHVADNWAGMTASPGERWDFFKRLHQQATVELAVLSPSKFVKDAKDPTEDELKQFFDEHKKDTSSPESSKPGFFVPRRVNIQYLAADEEKVESQITQKEIDQEYEKDPKRYSRDLESFQKEEKDEKEARDKEESANKPSTEKKTPEASKNGKEPESKTTKPAEGSAAKPDGGSAAKPEGSGARSTGLSRKSDEKPSEGGTASAETPVGAKPLATPEAKPEPTTTPEPAKPSATSAKPSGTSSAAAATPFRLVAYAVDKPADTAAAPAATSGTTDAASAAAKAPEEKKATEETKPAEEKKAAEEPKSSAASAVSKPADATKPAADQATQPKSSTVSGAKAVVKKEPPKPIKTARQRLDDSIRKDLAGKRLRDNIAKIKAVLEEYREKFASAGDGPKPAPPDFAALAKEYGMTAGITGSVSRQELFETDFGKSYIINSESGQYVPVSDLVFGSTAVFKVDVSYALFGEVKNRAYIFWKTDDQASGEPKWDADIKAKVRDVWKLVQARKLALDAADKLKGEISKGENAAKPLKSIVDEKQGIEVVQPPKFTWLSSLLGEQPAISSVGDLKNLGQDFMKKVFDLGAGQVTVATNLPQTEVYVIRLKEFTPFKELWDDFSSPDASTDYMRLLLGTVQAEVNPAWHNEIAKNAKFVDKRKEVKAAQQQQAPRPDEPEGPPPPEEY
jgi:hypothetical protein